MSTVLTSSKVIDLAKQKAKKDEARREAAEQQAYENEVRESFWIRRAEIARWHVCTRLALRQS